jgi:predicted HicB family RNase H-like nuclease
VSDTLEYKGYVGKVALDAEAGILHGEVLGTRDVITFQGESVTGLVRAFRESVDDYLAFCAERGEEPDKPFSGQFVVRVAPELHRRISLAATASGQSLNAWVNARLQEAVGMGSTGEDNNVDDIILICLPGPGADFQQSVEIRQRMAPHLGGKRPAAIHSRLMRLAREGLVETREANGWGYRLTPAGVARADRVRAGRTGRATRAGMGS